jgi:hypothetical protein
MGDRQRPVIGQDRSEPKGDLSPAIANEHQMAFATLPSSIRASRFGSPPARGAQNVNNRSERTRPNDHDVQFVAEGADVKPHPGRR